MIEKDENNPNAVWIDRAEKGLEQAYQRYLTDINQLAIEARDAVLVPWLKANGYEFTTGNGTWSITDPSKIKYLKDGTRDWRSYSHDLTDILEDIGAKDIDDLLRLEVAGSWGNGELGLWMQDYCKEKTRNGGGEL